MKKQILSIASIALVAGALVMSGCKKDDVTQPEITLVGDASVTISLNSTYTDAGATANDDRDGDLTSKVTVDVAAVDEDKTGTYTVTYSVTDEAGNVGEATRTVIVKNDADSWSGSYSAGETDVNGPYTYVQPTVVEASSTVNNRITMTRLGDFANNTVYMNITGSNIDMPSQTVSNVGTGGNSCDVHNRMSSGTGTKTATGFTLTYSDSKVAPCTGVRANVNATFTKQ